MIQLLNEFSLCKYDGVSRESSLNVNGTGQPRAKQIGEPPTIERFEKKRKKKKKQLNETNVFPQS